MNILQIFRVQKYQFSDEKLFLIFFEQGVSTNEYLQSIFKSENNVYPCKPHFYFIKVRFERVKIWYLLFFDIEILVH